MASTALPTGRSARYSHPSAHVDRRSGLARVFDAKSRPAAHVDHFAVAQGTADHRQAEYFVRLLNESRQLIDHRIDKYQRAIVTSEASGDVENASALRRMKCIEEKDRQVLLEMIDNLHRRFRSRASGAVAHISRRARPVVR
jgi:hypothetical protein